MGNAWDTTGIWFNANHADNLGIIRRNHPDDYEAEGAYARVVFKGKSAVVVRNTSYTLGCCPNKTLASIEDAEKCEEGRKLTSGWGITTLEDLIL